MLHGMERKTAADYPQELLNIFDQYVHGGIDRRGFLERAAKFAVGGVTAGRGGFCPVPWRARGPSIGVGGTDYGGRMARVWVTGSAGRWWSSPGWPAVIWQSPAASMWMRSPATEQAPLAS